VRRWPHAATPPKGPVISCLTRCTVPHAELAGNFQDAFPGPQLRLDAFFDGGIDPRATELFQAALEASARPSFCRWDYCGSACRLS
jgi:hypothetical protein